MLAHQQRRVRRVGAPAKRPVEQPLVLEARQVRGNRPADRRLGGVRVGVGRVLCMRAGHRDVLGRCGAVGLVRLVACVAGELVADLDDAVLVGLEEEADVAVVDYGDAFVLGCFGRCELDVGIYPGLGKLAKHRGSWTR